ncbi:MAG TPA: hypothetical protein VK177_10765 [Flavobacteriales bacterium]|nr:hypothetical protein [Flavobacteriales bacterium]
MISYLQGKQIAEKKIKALERENDLKFVLVESKMLETAKLWLFYYALKPASPTQELSTAGNAPIAVEKANGRVHSTGIARSIDFYIERIEEGI